MEWHGGRCVAVTSALQHGGAGVVDGALQLSWASAIGLVRSGAMVKQPGNVALPVQ